MSCRSSFLTCLRDLHSTSSSSDSCVPPHKSYVKRPFPIDECCAPVYVRSSRLCNPHAKSDSWRYYTVLCTLWWQPADMADTDERGLDVSSITAVATIQQLRQSWLYLRNRSAVFSVETVCSQQGLWTVAVARHYGVWRQMNSFEKQMLNKNLHRTIFSLPLGWSLSVGKFVILWNVNTVCCQGL